MLIGDLGLIFPEGSTRSGIFWQQLRFRCLPSTRRSCAMNTYEQNGSGEPPLHPVPSDA